MRLLQGSMLRRRLLRKWLSWMRLLSICCCESCRCEGACCVSGYCKGDCCHSVKVADVTIADVEVVVMKATAVNTIAAKMVEVIAAKLITVMMTVVQMITVESAVDWILRNSLLRCFVVVFSLSFTRVIVAMVVVATVDAAEPFLM